jgi:hypothetical protein
VFMMQPYSKEAQAILEDFLQTLSRRGDVDPDFLTDLRHLTMNGQLGNRSRIQRAIANLKVRADESKDRHHRDP